MQTKSEIENLLLSAGLEPNRRRGQNFLIDLNLMRLLIDTAHIHNNDVVLEVGCGTGSMTEEIVRRCGFCVGVEIEEALAKIATMKVEEAGNVNIICGDVLESKNTIDEKVIEAIRKSRSEYRGRLLLVSNLPYSVASPVMMNLVSGEVIADEMYVTVQKEVAERMTAEAGGEEYGTLSIFLNATGEIKLIRTLRPSVFWPEPQVDSAMISFVRKAEMAGRIKDMELFSEVVGLFMQHRRKMMKACTKFADGRLAKVHNWDSIFKESAVNSHDRPEQIPPEGYIAITNLCYENLRIPRE